MKKILFVFHVSTIGGGSYCLLNILKSLDRTTVKPYVLLCENGPLVDEIKKLGIEVFFLKDMRMVPYNWSLLTKSALMNTYHINRSFKDFRKIVLDLGVDIVYINTMMLYPYLKQAKTLKKKTVIHIREHWPEGEHKWQRERAIKHIKKYADHIVAINTYSASMLEERANDVVVVYDWVDFSERYEPISLNKIFLEDVSKKKIYLFTGGMARIKGGYQVLKCFTEKIKGEDKRLLFLGYDMDRPTGGFNGFLKRFLFKLGYEINEMKIRQIVANDKRIKCIPATYKLVDIINQSYCMLSYFTKPHANLAMVECLILGTPVVAAWTEEADEYSQGASHVCFFEMNNMDSFAEAVLRMDEKLQDNNPKPAKELEVLFSRDYNVDNLNNLIEQI
ncbi:MAG: glycosyltransferase [Bacteroidales bacterium]|nr:glycosyltransferase [Bacteroidales bacterium]